MPITQTGGPTPPTNPPNPDPGTGNPILGGGKGPLDPGSSTATEPPIEEEVVD